MGLKSIYYEIDVDDNGADSMHQVLMPCKANRRLKCNKEQETSDDGRQANASLQANLQRKLRDAHSLPGSANVL